MEEGLSTKRPTRRIVIYPPTLSEFSRVLTGEQFDPMEGTGIAYAKIANACSKYVVSPVFYSADSSEYGGIDPAIVPEWMNIAAQVATGGRSQVLENGPDVCNSASESDSENEEHGEELKGMYTEDVPKDEQGQPILAKCQLTATQCEILRLVAVLKSRASRQSSSGYLSSSESESEDSVDEFSRANPDAPKFSELVAIRKPTSEESTLIVAMTRDSREKFNRERKVPPNYKFPLAIRLDEIDDASRAGGLRPGVGGSGLTDTRMASGHPSHT
jgi:hypothetical protein